MNAGRLLSLRPHRGAEFPQQILLRLHSSSLSLVRGCVHDAADLDTQRPSASERRNHVGVLVVVLGLADIEHHLATRGV